MQGVCSRVCIHPGVPRYQNLAVLYPGVYPSTSKVYRVYTLVYRGTKPGYVLCEYIPGYVQSIVFLTKHDLVKKYY